MQGDKEVLSAINTNNTLGESRGGMVVMHGGAR